MSTNPTTSPYIRVLVELRHLMESEAFAARLDCEVGFRGVAAAPATDVGSVSDLGPTPSEFDVRLIEHCPERTTYRPAHQRSAPTAASSSGNEAGETTGSVAPSVVLVWPNGPLGGEYCACCKRVSRQARWPRLLDALAAACGRKPGRGLPTTDALANLTRRELDVLRLVGLGKSVAECAKELGVAHSTIGNHKYRLMRKLGATNSLQLLRIAVQNGVADFG